MAAVAAKIPGMPQDRAPAQTNRIACLLVRAESARTLTALGLKYMPRGTDLPTWCLAKVLTKLVDHIGARHRHTHAYLPTRESSGSEARFLVANEIIKQKCQLNPALKRVEENVADKPTKKTSRVSCRSPPESPMGSWGAAYLPGCTGAKPHVCALVYGARFYTWRVLPIIWNLWYILCTIPCWAPKKKEGGVLCCEEWRNRE
ncbi:hypothetical protein GGTG_06237 [Gaeumannomyces tritici R3-111a-1]|uniref:Uncharacterized protein n=1 Tax=Gaeumannomyces tritici (strain R3-111a-1) TaxID=644352 RepID=J3NY84_GAET3|nr:hypothetical protein GGTG_06237 [Gaeumannomyces tritici R3-111a-1]EJT76317.1 hypothetical protein GGTG_06237 [Gaeumannomyces tritici R3-111a-1]